LVASERRREDGKVTLQPGQILLHYRLIEKIGEGGMGVVWKAVDTTLDREVAIKVLPETFSADAERLARFEREAKLLAQLNHPNIAAVYSVHQHAGLRFLAMELVPGEDLAQRLRQGAFPVDEATGIALQIAEALEMAHEAGVVHRDLKPANVRLTPDGKVKVLDLGLAKALAADDAARRADPTESPTVTSAGTMAGVILGTAAYMSPEQARGRDVDRRTDIWAFGCVLYEMLTGRSAFHSGTVTDTLSAVISREPDLQSMPGDVPAAVRRLIRRCLTKDSRERLQAIGDARIELRDARDEDVEPETRPARPAARRVGVWAAVGILAAAVVGLVAGRMLAPTPASPEPVRVRALTFGGTDYAPTASPDGKLIAFTSTRGGVSRIWLKQLAGGGEQPLTEGPDSLPRFSPDGSSLLFLRDDGLTRSAYRVGIVGGQPRRIVDDVQEACWSPDGSEIAFVRDGVEEGGSRTNVLHVVGIEGGPERTLLSVDNWVLRGLNWSPDGGRILVTRNSPSGGATGWRGLLVDVGDGSIREIGPATPLTMVSLGTWSPDGSNVVLASVGNTIGDLSGRPARVARYSARDGGAETLFWWEGLFPFRGAGTASAQFAALGDGRLVFDTYEQRETLVEVTPDTGAARRRTIGTAADRQPAYSPDGRRVVFSSNRAGNLDLWLLDVESGALTQLTDDVAQDWDPAFTPDGRLLYSSDRGGNLEVWIAAADGSDPRQVSRDGVDAENPTMTADGRWIVYFSGNPDNPGIFRIRPDGTEPHRIAAGNFIVPEVSPDGRYAMFTRVLKPQPAEVRVVEIETGEPVDFLIESAYPTDAPNVTYGRSRWMPGGKAIALLGIDERGRTGVYVQDFVPGRDTTSSRRPLAGFFEHDITESFSVSPDGERVMLATVQEARNIMLAEGVPGF
jgi:Tol biopolymer transport system component